MLTRGCVRRSPRSCTRPPGNGVGSTSCATCSRACPRAPRRRFPATNPIERLHKEVKRRPRVVGIFPTLDSLMRMVGTLLAEQDDEWQVADRGYFSMGSMAQVDQLAGGGG